MIVIVVFDMLHSLLLILGNWEPGSNVAVCVLGAIKPSVPVWSVNLKLLSLARVRAFQIGI